jgi:hypothetical protein
MAHNSDLLLELPLGSQDVRLDQRMQRSQDRRAGADLICQRRQAQIDALRRYRLLWRFNG